MVRPLLRVLGQASEMVAQCLTTLSDPGLTIKMAAQCLTKLSGPGLAKRSW